jgi:hypothetical protein
MNGSNESTVLELDKLTKRYADANEALETSMRDLESVIEIVKREHFKTIKRDFVSAVERKHDLKDAIEANRELFAERKTMVLHGVKIGIVKSVGKIEIEDDEKTANLIKKHLPDLYDVLVKVIQKPIKKALNELPAADLRKIGVTIEEGGDVTVIKTATSEIEKLINKLFTEMEGDAEARAA